MLPRWLRGTRLPMPYAVPTGDGACAAALPNRSSHVESQPLLVVHDPRCTLICKEDQSLQKAVLSKNCACTSASTACAGHGR